VILLVIIVTENSSNINIISDDISSNIFNDISNYNISNNDSKSSSSSSSSSSDIINNHSYIINNDSSN
jgi:hypothetical protein